MSVVVCGHVFFHISSNLVNIVRALRISGVLNAAVVLGSLALHNIPAKLQENQQLHAEKEKDQKSWKSEKKISKSNTKNGKQSHLTQTIKDL